MSVSLDEAILQMLRERADSTHGGNLSAAIAEAAEVLHRQAARDVVANALMKGRPPLTDEQRTRLLEIADRCPISQTLKRGIEVVASPT